uniref:Cytochrome c oxidase subunit 2 n=1 Tax=Goniodes dissimilis TaxID=186210 RepID=A0A9E9EPQ8_9NEOP|nr:cytochrome c oxidase subunit II [Goniodes dissimilis]
MAITFNVGSHCPNFMLMHNLSLVDSFSPVMNHISSFHDHAMMIVIFIMSLVSHSFISIIFTGQFTRSMKSSEVLETFWTIIPCVILTTLAAPSLTTLYMLDEIIDPFVTLKVIGHQWYWSYEFEDLNLNQYNSYMTPTSELKVGDFRLLEVDKSVKIPVNCESRVIISSTDVVHSWTVPSMGVKIDAIPGRLNQTSLLPSRVGKVYGQCSEMCGAMHSFMPISLEVTHLDDFIEFMNKLS